MKFGAIDIGTNAIRLLISSVYEFGEQTIFKKVSLVRLPIRLGEDVFTHGIISEKKNNKLVKAMIAFKYILEIHEVDDYLACATSAMREAKNGNEVVKWINDNSKINLQIISGELEAEFVAYNQLDEYIEPNRNYLYIDVGGGSTELTLFVNGQKISSHSFKIGTVRLLNNMVEENEWEDMKNWIKVNVNSYNNLIAIGSGGNINTLMRIANAEDYKLTRKELKAFYKQLKEMNYTERIKNFLLKEDRADVIVPALKIFNKVMKWSNSNKIIAPQIGLVDGIVKKLYYDKIKGLNN
jgi:exopolyphosphatase/guanosine-5'-triphosphate,3'-diphosphate pyrophosphatase